jgi:hypothetical protein
LHALHNLLEGFSQDDLQFSREIQFQSKCNLLQRTKCNMSLTGRGAFSNERRDNLRSRVVAQNGFRPTEGLRTDKVLATLSHLSLGQSRRLGDQRVHKLDPTITLIEPSMPMHQFRPKAIN